MCRVRGPGQWISPATVLEHVDPVSTRHMDTWAVVNFESTNLLQFGSQQVVEPLYRYSGGVIIGYWRMDGWICHM